MSSLASIPVSVATAPVLPSGNAHAVLHEILTMLGQLADGQPGGAIDLRGLPLNNADFAILRDQLGRGEVSASVQAAGRLEILETAIPGVWWHTHYTHDGDIITEIIEITRFPDILASQHADISDGLSRLQQQLGKASGAKEESHV